MAVTHAIREALELHNLNLPESPTVVGVQAENLTDMDGEASLRITVLIDDETDLENINGKSIGAIKAEIRRSLEEHGISLFAYIFFAMPRELAEDARGEG